MKGNHSHVRRLRGRPCNRQCQKTVMGTPPPPRLLKRARHIPRAVVDFLRENNARFHQLLIPFVDATAGEKCGDGYHADLREVFSSDKWEAEEIVLAFDPTCSMAYTASVPRVYWLLKAMENKLDAHAARIKDYIDRVGRIRSEFYIACGGAGGEKMDGKIARVFLLDQSRIFELLDMMVPFIKMPNDVKDSLMYCFNITADCRMCFQALANRDDFPPCTPEDAVNWLDKWLKGLSSGLRDVNCACAEIKAFHAELDALRGK